MPEEINLYPEDILLIAYQYGNQDPHIEKYANKFIDKNKSARDYLLAWNEAHYNIETERLQQTPDAPGKAMIEVIIKHAYLQTKNESNEAIEKIIQKNRGEKKRLQVAQEKVQALDNVTNLIETLKFKESQETK